MKVWEKIMLYPIGLCYWIADSAKKTGNFIGRKAKPAIAMLVAVTMMLSLMPITAFAVSSDIIVALVSFAGSALGFPGNKIRNRKASAWTLAGAEARAAAESRGTLPEPRV